MDHVSNCLRYKTKLAFRWGLSAIALLLLHAICRQTQLRGVERSASVGAPSAVHMDSPGVFSEPELATFLEALRSSSLEDIHNTNLGTWAARKGLNNIGTLSNGNKVLMKKRNTLGDNRYRMQSELFSHYFNCYLDLWNTPPTALGCAREKKRENDARGSPGGCGRQRHYDLFHNLQVHRRSARYSFRAGSCHQLRRRLEDPARAEPPSGMERLLLVRLPDGPLGQTPRQQHPACPTRGPYRPAEEGPQPGPVLLGRPRIYSLTTRPRSTSVTPGRRQAP